MSLSALQSTMLPLMADMTALYFKSYCYHWNVKGKHFQSLHDLFEEHYNDLHAALDEVAEHLRMHGIVVAGGLSVFADHATIADGDANASEGVMVSDLKEGHAVIMGHLRDVMNAADKIGDDVIVDFVTHRMETHRKAHWFLASLLDEESDVTDTLRP